MKVSWVDVSFLVAAVACLWYTPTQSGDGTDEVLVDTAYGIIRGKLRFRSYGLAQDVALFGGVPFAESPVGSNRFRSSRPWRGKYPPGGLDGREVGPACYGHDQESVDQSEDCLRLDIYTPAGALAHRDSTEPLLPVMVWIHGGGFTSGYGGDPRYDGHILAAQQNAVVVSVNYRLDIFGFLSSDELKSTAADGLSGNMALMDCLMALSWVQDNIPSFTGDPHKVVVFGESAGAFIIATLLSMPKRSRGLFRSAIMESGGIEVFTRDDARRVYAKVLQDTSCQDGTGPSDRVRCLQGIPPARLLSKIKDLNNEAQLQRGQLGPWGPVVDGVVLPQHPMKAFLESHEHPESVLDVPLIIGSNEREGALFVFGEDFVSYKDARLGLSELRNLKCANETVLNKACAIYDLKRDSNNREGFARAVGDAWITCDTGRITERLSKIQRVWSYRFAYWSSCKVFGNGMGPTHTAELPFVFQSEKPYDCSFDQKERKIASQFGAWWAEMARNGNPGGAWGRYSNEGGQMWIEESGDIRFLKAQTVGYDNACSLWHQLPLSSTSCQEGAS